MQLYSGLSPAFIDDATHDRIAEKLQAAFFTHFRYRVPVSEVAAWRNSLAALSSVLRQAQLEDHGVLLEYQLPLSSKRLDVMVTGHDGQGAPNAVVVELKQWTNAIASSVEGCVATFVGGRIRDELHPSLQVGQYHQYLADCHTAFADGGIGLASCSFLHNFHFNGASEFFQQRHLSAPALSSPRVPG